MRVILFTLVALALLCVAAAQPSAAPVTLSFSYEQAAFQPTHAPAAHDDAAMQQSMAAAATDAAPPRSHHLPGPIITIPGHPITQSHTHQLSINDTTIRADNTTAGSGSGVMVHNSTTITKVDRTVVRENAAKNATAVEKRVTEKREGSEKEERERKEGDKEASFPDDNPAHNITHPNRTISNHSQR